MQPLKDRLFHHPPYTDGKQRSWGALLPSLNSGRKKVPIYLERLFSPALEKSDWFRLNWEISFRQLYLSENAAFGWRIAPTTTLQLIWLHAGGPRSSANLTA